MSNSDSSTNASIASRDGRQTLPLFGGKIPDPSGRHGTKTPQPNHADKSMHSHQRPGACSGVKSRLWPAWKHAVALNRGSGRGFIEYSSHRDTIRTWMSVMKATRGFFLVSILSGIQHSICKLPTGWSGGESPHRHSKKSTFTRGQGMCRCSAKIGFKIILTAFHNGRREEMG